MALGNFPVIPLPCSAPSMARGAAGTVREAKEVLVALWIVNPNAVFDRTITLDRLVPGAVSRTLSVELTAGGKGINVARVLRTLGHRAPLTIPVGAEDLGRYGRLLSEEGAEANLVEVSGAVRIASIYLEQSSPRVTVINDAGDAMSMADWTHFVDSVTAKIDTSDVVLCMGSFPPGLEPTVLADFITRVHARGASILIDVNPLYLAAALSSQPDVVTPNLEEAEAALQGLHAHTMDAVSADSAQIRARALSAAEELCRLGALQAFVTAGEHGVAFASEGTSVFIPGLSVNVVSTVGAGDSFVGGLTSKWLEAVESGVEIDWVDACSFGIATSASSCEQVRAGGIDLQRVDELYQSMLAAVQA